MQNHKYVNKIESAENEKIKLVKKLSGSRKYRCENNCFIVEGLRLCYDACNSNVKILKTFYTENAYVKSREKLDEIIKRSEKSYVITENISRKISDTLNPQGIFCVIQFFNNDNTVLPCEKIIILENIQDPSNLGTILRSADAFGVKNVIMSPGCTDVYSPKVLRGSMGAIFRLNFIIPKDFMDFIMKLNVVLYATVPDKSAQNIANVTFTDKTALIIGNEGYGISTELLRICKKITIPMVGLTESLNAAVAASIAMWEMTK